MPDFRFNRLAYVDGNFLPSGKSCDFCDRRAPLIYQGPIYVAKPEPSICDLCIAAGNLGERYGRKYPLFGDFQMEDAEPELVEEVFIRTPGFPTFNPFSWPAIERTPLAFFGHGDRQDVWGEAGARAAMEQASLEVWGEPLAGPSSYLLVFREVGGTRWHAAVDLD